MLFIVQFSYIARDTSTKERIYGGTIPNWDVAEVRVKEDGTAKLCLTMWEEERTEEHEVAWYNLTNYKATPEKKVLLVSTME